MSNGKQPSQEATTLDLEKARERVTSIADDIARLFCERQKAMRQIAEAKNGNNDSHLPIYLPQREQELLVRFRKIAEEYEVDPGIMEMFMTMLMSLAKFAQMEILDRSTILDTERPKLASLKENLLALTKVVAEHYDQYDNGKEGTHIECVRERQLFEGLINVHQGGVAVNLGCASGDHVTDILGQNFQRIVGYDISPDMIKSAKMRYPEHEFCVHDLDDGIPHDDNSVDLLIANFGTASEVCQQLWEESRRVLRQGGIAYFSFYNQDALVTKWWTPWSNAFNITINPHNDTVMVPCVDSDGNPNVYWIHGKSVSDKDVRASALSQGLEVLRIESSSPLWDDKPPEFFKHEAAVKAATAYEEGHAHIPPFLGQYLRVIVKKNDE